MHSASKTIPYPLILIHIFFPLVQLRKSRKLKRRYRLSYFAQPKNNELLYSELTT
jgi:hypothetical protein